jgi:hypothetical protein
MYRRALESDKRGFWRSKKRLGEKKRSREGRVKAVDAAACLKALF